MPESSPVGWGSRTSTTGRTDSYGAVRTGRSCAPIAPVGGSARGHRPELRLPGPVQRRVLLRAPRHYLSNVLLRDTDMMGMAHSLEIREPLLDHELIQYVACLPGAIKARSGPPKSVLIDALGADMPVRIARRKKMGFTLPFDRWLRGPLRRPVQAALLDPSFGGQAAGALDADAVTAVWRRFVEGKGAWARTWALYTLKCWCERYLPTTGSAQLTRSGSSSCVSSI